MYVHGMEWAGGGGDREEGAEVRAQGVLPQAWEAGIKTVRVVGFLGKGSGGVFRPQPQPPPISCLCLGQHARALRRDEAAGL